MLQYNKLETIVSKNVTAVSTKRHKSRLHTSLDMLQLLYKPKIQGRVFYTLQIVLFQQQETEKYFCKQSADLF